jgi:putative nucleotidyltransferase with HDIG domain
VPTESIEGTLNLDLDTNSNELLYQGLYEHESINPEELEKRAKEVTAYITDLIEDGEFCKLVEKVMEIYGMELCECIGSATKHHNKLGKLMDHLLEVVKIALAISESLGIELDMDVIITGAFLHDIGKIWAYEDKPDNIKRRKTGEFDEQGEPIWTKRPVDPFMQGEEAFVTGHFQDALYMLQAIMFTNNIKINKSRERNLWHVIATHHGEARLRWGSLVDPRTNEAHIVSSADLISSRVRV